MPDLNGKKVLVIGAGPNTIGQSGECDEGAVEACQAITAMGGRIVVVNSNPDAVVNDGPGSPRLYIEPLTAQQLEAVIAAETPDAILPLFGGRDGLQLAARLMSTIANRHPDLSIWGPTPQTLEAVHNRQTLQAALAPIHLQTPTIFEVRGVEAALAKARELGFPVILRCDDARQLPDGTLVYNADELSDTATLLAGETSDRLTVEASLVDWQLYGIEVLRDATGKALHAGSVEYLDSAAVHPGDAVGVCPPQALETARHKRLVAAALAIADHLGIVGSATVRFALHPVVEKPLVLAVHPRYTAASALVSRVTGLPIARLATLLAAGIAWGDLPADMATPGESQTEPGWVAVRYPSWNFERLQGVADRLGPKLQSVGHSIGCGLNFSEALQKAVAANNHHGRGLAGLGVDLEEHTTDGLLDRMATPSSRRLIIVFEALRRQVPVEVVIQKTGLAAWYIEQLADLAAVARRLESMSGGRPEPVPLARAMSLGFGLQDLAILLDLPTAKIDAHLDDFGIQGRWAAMSGDTRHWFRTYATQQAPPHEPARNAIVILGSGPQQIGNGGEQDYGIYHAAVALKAMGYAPIIINSNAVGVTTGPASPAPCYCEPLRPESVKAIVRREGAIGAIIQFAGPRGPGLGALLAAMGVPVMGTPAAAWEKLRDRSLLHAQIKALGIPQPQAVASDSPEKVVQAVTDMGYPVAIQPAQPNAEVDPVLINDAGALEAYLSQKRIDERNPAWVEQFLEYAIEVQAEVLCDGRDARAIAVLEHIELAGVHAGDSVIVLPPYSIAPRHIETIRACCAKTAPALAIRGLVNLRFAIYRDTVYLLAAACGENRNLGLVSRTTGLPLVDHATRIMVGGSLAELAAAAPPRSEVGVRAPVFPFHIFSEVDPLLGPQMRATGQVLAMAEDFGSAYFQAIAAAGTPLPTRGTVLITVTDEDKASILEAARIFDELGFALLATKGTRQALMENGIEARLVRKLGYGRPNLVDEIKNGNVQLVINTPTGGQGQIDDSIIRKAAIAYGVANITTPASALAAARGIAAHRAKATTVSSEL